MTILAAVAAGLAVFLAQPTYPRLRRVVEVGRQAAPRRILWWRPLLCALAGLAAWLFVGGSIGVVAASVAAGAAWVALVRAEPGDVRREREEVARDLPHFVDLLACALRSGAAPSAALATVAAACPGATAQRVNGVLVRLRLGIDPTQVWTQVATDDALAPLGRTLARAEATGSSVAEAVERLADDLERGALATVEDRARAVGVKAAVPLGLCLLPAFLLIGIVPTVAGLLNTLTAP